MPRVGFEPTIPASKRVKTVHTLDHSAAVTGLRKYSCTKTTAQGLITGVDVYNSDLMHLRLFNT
jgi:hypothetical protein